MRLEVNSRYIGASEAAKLVAAMKLNDEFRDSLMGTHFRVVGVMFIPGSAMPDDRYVQQIWLEDDAGRQWIGTDWGMGVIEHLRTIDVDYHKRTLYD